MRHLGVGGLAVTVIALAAVATEGRAAAAGPNVDLALVLAVDASASVDAREFALQLEGLAAAFRDPEVASAIADGPAKRIAVAVVEWAGAAQQIVAVPWTVVGDRADAAAVASRIESIERTILSGATSITGALTFGGTMLAAAPFEATRRVIDLSGDGRNNQGQNVEDARRNVLAQGVTINGLAILNEHPTLHHYFQDRVVGGADAFVEVAEDYGAYVAAMRRKLLREIRGLAVSEIAPDPASTMPETAGRLAAVPPPQR